MTSQINLSRKNNHYWDNGAYCGNCGILKGNVTNNGIHPIWHTGCKVGCNSTWEDQDPILSDDEYAHLLDEEERWRNACRDPRQEEEEDELQPDYAPDIEQIEREDMSYEDSNVLTLEQEYSATMCWENLHAYHEDDEELELEAREEYRREMEAQEREEDAMEERDRIECGYGRSYYDDDGDDDERD